MLPRLKVAWVAAAWCVLFAPHAQASDGTCADAPTRVTLRSDNDFFAGQDQGYSSGLQLKAATPDIAAADETCLGSWSRRLHERLQFLSPADFEQRNLVFGLGQIIYTPSDPDRQDPDPRDRPYAGALFVSAGYNARRADALRTRELAIGMVGPASLAEETQAFFHHVFGSRRFRGWSNQLKNEPVFMLRQIESRRFGDDRAAPGDGLRWDAVTHWGGALGNFRTEVGGGIEWRLGRHLPDDFGTNPVRFGAENDAPRGAAAPAPDREDGVAWHGFVALGARWVLRDITLDGNTWRNGPSVDRKSWVGDAAVGVAVQWGRWKLALARNYRTREFDAQHPRPSFGSLSISRAL